MRARRRLIAAALALAAVAIVAAVGAGRRARRHRPSYTVQAVRIRVPAGYALAGDLYLPRRADRPAAALVFLHGSSPHGYRLALYPSLCERLAARGYAVLNLNQRGYEGSEGPTRVRSLDDLDFVGDARAVAGQLAGLLGAPPREIVLAGHSFGGGVAAVAGLASPAVDRVISISPGRRIAELFPPDRPDRLRYVQRRRTEDLRLAEPIPIELVRPLLDSYDIGQFRGATLPKPLLLVEGAREPADDLAFTAELAEGLKGPVTRVVIPGADHYFGASVVESAGGKEWALTNPETLDRLAAAIARWLEDGGP